MHRSRWLLLLLAFVCATASFATSRELLRLRRDGRAGGELMYFPSGYLLKPMAVGHPLTLADFLWLRAIQYYGEHRMSDNRFPMAGHIFEVITELDPNFVEAYMFGGLVLAAEGGDLDRGLVLLRQGIAWNPERWELPFWTGFVHYVSTRDHAQAARFFTRSSRLPGAPPYVKRFAAYTTTQVGDLAAALALWEDLLESSDHPAMRALAEQKVAEIRAQLAARAGEPS